MATMDYVEIPSYATRLHSEASPSNVRSAPKITTPLPRPDPSDSPASPHPAQSPPKQSNSIPSILLSAGLHLPSASPASHRDASHLLSTRDPLSLPITTTNFRRFVGNSGPIFWLQDKAEEILMWRKGWELTSAWMAGYAFICYFPRLVLLLPHTALLTIILTAHSSRHTVSPDDSDSIAPPSSQPPEGSKDWYANLQAIQNLMGAVSDAHDFAMIFVPHLTYSSPYTNTILTATVVSLIVSLPMLYLLPLRPTFLILGLLPFAFTHPWTQRALPALLAPHRKHLQMRLARLADDDRLAPRHWLNPRALQEVALWENARFAPGAGWDTVHLRPGERRAWTRGRDGWSGVAPDGAQSVSNLTFSLAPGWAFVETEDWRVDLEATWIDVESDLDGWIYTNDAWLDPQSAPVEEWQTKGLTRRRRWIRRIYYDPTLSM